MTSVLVIQMGARRGYELARMLEVRGSLAVLQTGAAWAEGNKPSSLLRRLLPVDDGVIARRTIIGVPQEKVRTTFVPEAVGFLLKRAGVQADRRHGIEDWFLGLEARRRGLNKADVVLSTTGNGGLSFLRWAKRQGARIAIDVVITPLVDEIVAEERNTWPGWEPSSKSTSMINRNRKRMEELVSLSDIVICPSPTVRDGLSTLCAFSSSKLVEVPYALGAAKIAAGKPEARRVLFAGSAELRKGIPYLAEAARRLTPRGYRIRVAGHASAAIRARPECRELIFLGHLSAAEMLTEFRSADLFCLPSLAEGMASVTLEALAHGLPCIVTRAAGAPVLHGREGLIVPERDGAATAAAIAQIAEDRALRSTMSKAAFARAKMHTLEVVGDLLHKAVVALPS